MGQNGVHKLEERGDFVYGLDFGKACEVAADTLGVSHSAVNDVLEASHGRIKNALAGARRPQWSVRNTSIADPAVTMTYWHRTTTDLSDNCADGNGAPEEGRPRGMAPGTTIQLRAVPFNRPVGTTGKSETNYQLSLFI